MNTICVIGNSHAACLRAPSLAATKGKKSEYVFFCANTSTMQALTRKEQLLLPRSKDLKRNFRRTSGGKEVIDLSIYETFIVVGLRFGIENILQIYRNFRTSRMNYSQSRYLVSEAYFRSAACDALRASEAFRVIRMIRAVSRKRLILVPNPRRVLDFQGRGYPTVLGTSAAELALLDLEYRLACKSAVPASIVVHHQPDETLSDGFYTRAELGILNGQPVDLPDLSEIPEGKFTHMNETYGSLLLNSMIGHLGPRQLSTQTKGT